VLIQISESAPFYMAFFMVWSKSVC